MGVGKFTSIFSAGKDPTVPTLAEYLEPFLKRCCTPESRDMTPVKALNNADSYAYYVMWLTDKLTDD